MFVDDERVSLVESGLLFAVFEEEFDGTEIDGFDAQAENVESLFVGDERVGALL